MEQSLVSVDTLALRFWAGDADVSFGVAPRGWAPFEGELALPGVLLGRGERLAAAARRACVTKLGVAETAIAAVGQLTTFDEPNRDPRGPTLSIAMWAVVHETPPAADTRWFPFEAHPPLAFDHDRIVASVRPILGENLWRNVEFTRSLTGARFSASQAVALTAGVLGAPPDAGNLNRTLRSVPGLARTTERVRTKATGRPASVWEWSAG